MPKHKEQKIISDLPGSWRRIVIDVIRSKRKSVTKLKKKQLLATDSQVWANLSVIIVVASFDLYKYLYVVDWIDVLSAKSPVDLHETSGLVWLRVGRQTGKVKSFKKRRMSKEGAKKTHKPRSD